LAVGPSPGIFFAAAALTTLFASRIKTKMAQPLKDLLSALAARRRSDLSAAEIRMLWVITPVRFFDLVPPLALDGILFAMTTH
jgi:hypothetical protein